MISCALKLGTTFKSLPLNLTVRGYLTMVAVNVHYRISLLDRYILGVQCYVGITTENANLTLKDIFSILSSKMKSMLRNYNILDLETSCFFYPARYGRRKLSTFFVLTVAKMDTNLLHVDNY